MSNFINNKKKTAQWTIVASNNICFIIPPQVEMIRFTNENHEKEVAKQMPIITDI